MTAAAIPWLLFAATFAVLIAATVGLLLDHRTLRHADADIDQLAAELDAADTHIDQLTADNANLHRNWRQLSRDLARARHDLARMRGERDLARGTVRDLLDAQRAGYRYPRPQPMPMPGVDNALTEEFTKIVERNIWPEVPPS